MKGGKMPKVKAQGKKPETPGWMKGWLNPRKLYREKDAFGSTFAKYFRNDLKGQINDLLALRDPSKMTALEIGPGAKHVIGDMGFKEKNFMDISGKVLDSLKKGLEKEGHANNTNYFRGAVERLPFGRGRRFGIVVANEVFTHVRPADRIRAAEGLADISDFLVITDREPRKLYENESPAIRAGFVNPKKIADALVRKGFDVHIHRPIRQLVERGQGEDYFIIRAERATNPKDARLLDFESLKMLRDFLREDTELMRKFGYPKKR